MIVSIITIVLTGLLLHTATLIDAQERNGNISTDISNRSIIGINSSLAQKPEIIVQQTDNHNIRVKKGDVIIYEGKDATLGIQEALNELTAGQGMLIYNGSYSISHQLNLSDGTYVYGQSNATILDFSGIGKNDAILMEKNSYLSNIKLEGSINPLPKDFTQKVKPNDNTSIENVLISNMGYGIDVTGAKNVTLVDIRCEFIQSISDWAACIHGGPGTHGLSINQFTIAYSNRGIELDANATNVTASNGYMFKIQNFNNTGHEAFSLDVHNHEDGEGRSQNIKFGDIYMKDSYAPTVKISPQRGSGENASYAIADLPKDIVYQNITLVNPTSEWQINGDSVSIKNSNIVNPTTNVMALYKNSRNVWIENVHVYPIKSDNQFISNVPDQTGIDNLTLYNNTIVASSNKSGSIISLHDIGKLTLGQNVIVNVPSDSKAISVTPSGVLDVCNNLIKYSNGTQEIWGKVCNNNFALGSFLAQHYLPMFLKQDKLLRYENDSFILERQEKTNESSYNNTRLWEIKNDNNTVTIYAGRGMRDVTIWSNPIEQDDRANKLNYIQAKFRIIDNSGKSTDNHAGIVWDDGEKEWYVMFRGGKISIYNSIDKEFAESQEVVREKGITYNLEVLFLENNTIIYLDNNAVLQLLGDSASNIDIHRIGIKSDNVDAEFEPLRIGIVEP